MKRLAVWVASLLCLVGSTGCGSDSTAVRDRIPLVSTTDLPAAEAGEVHLFGINDLHGNLEPPTGSNGLVAGYPAGGAGYLAAHLARLRAAYPASAVVAAGDNVGASPLASSLFHDEPTIDVLDSIGTVASSVGNHEFDHGVIELGRLQQGGCPSEGCSPGAPFTGASFPYLAANVTDANGRTPPGLRPWTVRRIGGHTIGFVGVVTPDTVHIVAPEGIRGYTFGNEVDAIDKYVPEIRAAGAETVVGLVHDGGVQQPRSGAAVDYNGCANIGRDVTDLASRVDPAVSVLLTGHTHQPYVCTIAGKVVSQAYSYGRLITDVRLRFGADHRVRATAVNRVVTRDVIADPSTTALVNFYVQQAGPRAARVVGAIGATLSHEPSPTGESPLGDVIADSMLAATASPAAGGAVAAFMNAGGVRADLVMKPGGTVTYGDIHAVAPFGNQVVTMSLTGRQILSLLGQQFDGAGKHRGVLSPAGISYGYSGATHTVIPGSVRIAGLPLNPVVVYRIATNDFLAAGGDGFDVFTHGADPVVGPGDLDALEAYFRGPQAPVPAEIRDGAAGPVPIMPPANRIDRK